MLFANVTINKTVCSKLRKNIYELQTLRISLIVRECLFRNMNRRPRIYDMLKMLCESFANIHYVMRFVDYNINEITLFHADKMFFVQNEVANGRMVAPI